jgi:hypothetical protein
MSTLFFQIAWYIFYSDFERDNFFVFESNGVPHLRMHLIVSAKIHK